MKIDLSPEDVDLITEALDSHAYWQLSEDQYRNDGVVQPPGSDDPDDAAVIARCEDLAARLAAQVTP